MSDAKKGNTSAVLKTKNNCKPEKKCNCSGNCANCPRKKNK